MSEHKAEIAHIAPCCGHHLACHDWHEDGWGHQGCGHIGCECPKAFSQALAERMADVWDGAYTSGFYDRDFMNTAEARDASEGRTENPYYVVLSPGVTTGGDQ